MCNSFSRLTSTALLLIAFTILLVNCQENNENLAGVKHFYFEFIDSIQADYSRELVTEVSEILIKGDYLISEESANAGWPFYETVKRGKTVFKTDMMPPHSNVNRLSPITSLESYNENEHTMKVVFTIKPGGPDNIIITKESFEWVDNNWRKFSKKLNSEFELKTENKSKVFDRIAKTLIRYTFK